MKQCSGCHKEIDKYAIACQYCGKLTQEKDKTSPKEQNKEDSKEEKE